LRDYGCDNQIGSEPSPDEYVNNLVAIFTEIKRILKKNGTLWLNIGDSYTQSGKGYDYDPKRTPKMRPTRINSGKHWGLGGKQLLCIPFRVAMALQGIGWILRQDIIWFKPNPMPEPVKDRCTKSHEYIFLFSKNKNYYYNHESMKEPATYAGRKRGKSINRYEQTGVNLSQNYETRNMRDVWAISPERNITGHYAVFPKELARRCIIAGCPENGTVIDPFAGSGTTCYIAQKCMRNSIGIELNPLYAANAIKRIGKTLF
jgi:DNA modification methylase